MQTPRRFSLATLAALTVLSACSGVRPDPSPVVAPSAPVAAGPVLVDPLAPDPATRRGVLDNGLTYIVRPNAEPRARAELRLVVNAGSVLEDDDQRGLAHLLEHMAFNGTERFPEAELIRYLESTGMQFGPDVNAYTSFDETVYILQVATDSTAQFETGLDVLREWAGAVTITDEELDKERGVVLEEWRSGRGAFERVRNEQFPVLFAGARYAERLPIGLPEVIQNAPAERVRAFYRDWYRPDLMAVVVVGDVDPDATVEGIRRRFGSLTNPADAPERALFPVPGHAETRVTIVEDAELPQSRLDVTFKRPVAGFSTVADARDTLVRSLFSQILTARLQELTRSDAPPFAAAFAGFGGGVRTRDIASLIAIVPPDGAVRALSALVTEAERIRRHGVTEAELDRARRAALRQVEQDLQQKDQRPSGRIAQAYVQSFLTGRTETGIENWAALAPDLLAGIRADEVGALAADLLTENDRVVQIAVAATPAGPPTEAEVRAALAAVAAADIAPYEEDVSDAPLVAAPPAPGAVVAERAVEGVPGATEWTLSNGVRVVVKPTDFRNEEILVTALSPGGTSRLDDATFARTRLMTQFVTESGVGAFSATDLQKRLAGQVVSLRPFVGERSEGFSGQAAPADLETLFQLLHLYATAPRADSSAFRSVRANLASFLATQGTFPQVAFVDTLQAALAQNHPRRRSLSLADLDRADLRASEASFRERFADLGDLVVIVVGAVDPAALRPLAETYLASLPAAGREDLPRDLGIRPPPGDVRRTVRRGTDDAAQVALVYTSEPAAVSLEEEAAFAALGQVLETVLREELREERGGTYGVGVQASVTREPFLGTSLVVQFGTDPARVDELIAAVEAAIEAVRAEGVEARVLGNVREAAARQNELSLRENRYWLTALTTAYERDVSPETLLATPARTAALTEADLRDAARRFVDPARRVKVALRPASE